MTPLVRAVQLKKTYEVAGGFLVQLLPGVSDVLVDAALPLARGALVYLAITRQLFSAKVWKRLHPFLGTAIILAVAAYLRSAGPAIVEERTALH